MRKRIPCTPFGKRVKIKLLEENMTSRDLAQKAGVTDATVCDVIFGRNKKPETMQLIAEALGIEVEEETEPEQGEPGPADDQNRY